MKFEEAKDIVEKRSRDYAFLDDEWKNDERIINIALKSSYTFLMLPEKYQTLGNAIESVKKDPGIYFVLPQEMQKNKEIVKAMMNTNSLSSLATNSAFVLLFKNHPIMNDKNALIEFLKKNTNIYDFLSDELRCELFDAYVQIRKDVPQFIRDKYQKKAKDYYEALYLGAPQLADFQMKTKSGKTVDLHSVILKNNNFNTNLTTIEIEDETKLEEVIRYLYTRRVYVGLDVHALLEILKVLIVSRFITVLDDPLMVRVLNMLQNNMTAKIYMDYRRCFQHVEERLISLLSKDELLKLLVHYHELSDEEKKLIVSYIK